MINPHKERSKAENSFLLVKARANDALTIRELLQILSRRGYPLLLLLFSLPFCQPIQIPGFSTPFGLLIVFVGLRMAFGHRIWLPSWVLNKTIPQQVLYQITHKGLWLTNKLTKFTSVRWEWISQNPILQTISGLLICILGLILALPLPIPLSNMVVAWAILFISIGLLEDDGYFILLGYGIGILSLMLFGGLFYVLLP